MTFRDSNIVDAEGHILSYLSEDDLVALLEANEGLVMMLSPTGSGNIAVEFISHHEAAALATQEDGPDILVDGVVIKNIHCKRDALLIPDSLRQLTVPDIEPPDVTVFAQGIAELVEVQPPNRALRRGRAPQQTWPQPRRGRGWGKKR